MTGLNVKQAKFTAMLVELIRWGNRQSDTAIVIAEVERSQTQADHDAAIGSGIVHSLHTLRLAADLVLFIDGAYQTRTAAYEPLGLMWEQLGGSWGGRFSKPDGNHFSLEHNGVR
jgi:hypothetical protein